MCVYVCIPHAVPNTQNSLENNLFQCSVQNALFGLDAAQTTNTLTLVKLPL